MKRIFTVALCLILLLTVLSACQTSNKSTADQHAGKTAEPQTIELTIAHNMDFVTIPNSIIAAGDRLTKKYADQGKNIKLVFKKQYYTIDWTEYHNKIVFAHKSGNAPDIFSLSGDVPGLVQAGTLLNVNDLMLPEFKKELFEPFKNNGNYYGVPIDMPIRVLYYSKKVLRDLKWTEQQITDLPQEIAQGKFTFENFMEVAKKAVDQKAAKYGLAHRPGSGPDFMEIMNTLGGEYYTPEGKLVFDEAGIQRTFEFFYKNAVVDKITPNNSSQIGWDTINKMVGTSEAFSYFGPLFSSTYVAKSSNKTPEQLAADVSFVLFPVSQYNKKPFAVAAPEGVGISSKTKYPEICKDLIKELATTSNDLLANHAATIFALPPVQAAMDNPLIAQHPILKDVKYMSDYTKVVPSINGLNFYLGEFFKQIQQLELGKTSAQKAVKDFKTQVQLNIPTSDVVFK